MRIVIDARLYGLENAGLGRYTINLVNELQKLDKSNEYFILLRKKYFNQLNFNEEIKIGHRKKPIKKLIPILKKLF